MVGEWEGVGASWSKEKVVSWSLNIPVLEQNDIILKVHRHLEHDQDVWWVSCPSITFGPENLRSGSIEGAKVEALQRINEVIGDMATAIGRATE